MALPVTRNPQEKNSSGPYFFVHICNMRIKFLDVNEFQINKNKNCSALLLMSLNDSDLNFPVRD